MAVNLEKNDHDPAKYENDPAKYENVHNGNGQTPLSSAGLNCHAASGVVRAQGLHHL